MKRFLIYLLSGLLCQVSFCNGQQHLFRLLNTQNGLYNNQVRFIQQLTDGRILSYTEGMFNLYNGFYFEQLSCDLTHTIPLGMHNQCTAYDGGNGLLWAKDFFRLYLFDTRTYRFCTDIKERFKNAQIKEPFRDFILDDDKNAWIITESDHLYRYDWKNKAKFIYQLSPEEKTEGIKIQEVIQGGPFHLIFMNNGRIYCWEEKTARIISIDDTHNDGVPSDYFRVKGLRQDTQHLLLAFGNQTGILYQYNIYTREWKKILECQYINDIQKDRKGQIWLGGKSELFCLSPDLKIRLQLDHFQLLHNSTVSDDIMSILIDSNQQLWLGMGASGILQAISSENYLQNYSNLASSHAASNLIRSLQPYNKNELLAGTMGGLFLFNTSDKTYRVFRNELSNTYCTDIKRDNKGRYWISSRRGLLCLDGKAVTIYNRQRLKQMTSEIVRFSLPLADGRILLCNGLKDIILFNPETEHCIRPDLHSPEFERCRALSFAIEITPGQIILGSQSGIFSFHTDRNKLTDLDWVKPWEKFSNKYNCAYIKDNRLWIGTQNGLLYHNCITKQTVRLSTEDGLPNNCIQGIISTPENDYWISTSNGISKLRPQNDSNFVVVRLGKADGAPSCEMMEQSIAIMPDKHVYVGSVNGITDISPETTTYPDKTLKPYLVGLRIMNHEINNEGIFQDRQILPEGMTHTNKIILKYNENFIDFRFSALNYEMPQRTYYRYRLDGVDKTWNYSISATGLCTASYTSLSPGTYHLQVQASLGPEKWGETNEWVLEIKPPFWKTWWAYTLYTILSIALAAFIIELYIADKRSRMIAEQETLKRQREQQLDELKFRFFTNISHEFRTPLALIITPLELLIKRTTNESIKNELEKILHSAKDLLSLVNQLLDFRRLEQKGEQLKPAAVSIKSFIESNVSRFNELTKEKHINLVCECQFTDEDIFYLDSEKITRVINNLLSNAIKFTSEGGLISIQAGWTGISQTHPEPDGISISVSDTGIGIHKKDLNNIFERFYQSDNQNDGEHLNTGSGIGLHLSKGYVELHHGTIKAVSEEGKGSRFTIWLPLSEHAVQEKSTVTQQQTTGTLPNDSQSTSSEVQNSSPTEEANTILIVEDNESFRHFMRELLHNDYNILLASDGQEGLEMAQHYNPDLIISDVMMPRMDGYALCRAIKSDAQCSHIPFVLLTAKNSSESRSGAYDAGADSFIAKPFDIDVLTSRIHQLLEQKLKRQESFIHEVKIDPKEITISDIDEEFIKKAVDCVEKNIENPDYSVESLSTDIGVDRSHLYRKMQAIVGLKPSEFIRNIRLKRAAYLLENSKYPVQQISLMVGFNTPRYFSLYFKETYGMTPSQYLQQKRAQNNRHSEA
jgi:signal transduction histidine kinase/DNA-binding response OmpR family regulator/ligand-binding sensor domain-containing protein